MKIYHETDDEGLVIRILSMREEEFNTIWTVKDAFADDNKYIGQDLILREDVRDWLLEESIYPHFNVSIGDDIGHDPNNKIYVYITEITDEEFMRFRLAWL